MVRIGGKGMTVDGLTIEQLLENNIFLFGLLVGFVIGLILG